MYVPISSIYYLYLLYLLYVGQQKPMVKITLPKTKSKITAAVWGALDEYLIFGHDGGEITQWDAKYGEEVAAKYDDHKAKINDLQLSKDGSMLITSSKDTYAKVSSCFSCLLLRLRIHMLRLVVVSPAYYLI